MYLQRDTWIEKMPTVFWFPPVLFLFCRNILLIGWFTSIPADCGHIIFVFSHFIFSFFFFTPHYYPFQKQKNIFFFFTVFIFIILFAFSLFYCFVFFCLFETYFFLVCFYFYKIKNNGNLPQWKSQKEKKRKINNQNKPLLFF